MHLFFSGEEKHTFRFFKRFKRSCILNYLEFLEASVVSLCYSSKCTVFVPGLVSLAVLTYLLIAFLFFYKPNV